MVEYKLYRYIGPRVYMACNRASRYHVGLNQYDRLKRCKFEIELKPPYLQYDHVFQDGNSTLWDATLFKLVKKPHKVNYIWDGK